MNMYEWAKKEVEIACKKENPERKDGEFDYGCACYQSALKAFKSLTEDGHSGMSIGITKNILNRMIDCKPLTPIEDTEDIWRYVYDRKETGAKVYQCTRMSSLFKDVYPDGSIKYSDNDRYVKIDINNPNVSWHSSFIRRIGDEMFPITMPYIPATTPYKFFGEDFLTDRKNGDFDTVGIYYVIAPDGERVDVNRYFKDSETDSGFEEIDVDEYKARKELAEMRIRKESEENVICN